MRACNLHLVDLRKAREEEANRRKLAGVLRVHKAELDGRKAVKVAIRRPSFFTQAHKLAIRLHAMTI